MSDWLDKVVSAIRELKDKKEALTNKYDRDMASLDELKSQLATITESIELTTTEISRTKGAMESVDKSIQDTESGLAQIMESGNALMALASNNLKQSRAQNDR